jgi:hypothetical protein
LITWLKAQKKQAEQAPSISDSPIPSGRRDNTLTSIAGKLRNDGLEYEEIYAALSRINAERCQPPLDDADVVRISKSVCRYPVGNPGPTLLISGKLPGEAHLWLAG